MSEPQVCNTDVMPMRAHHPHLHMIVPGGGLSMDDSR
jgi:hypothetical protein